VCFVVHKTTSKLECVILTTLYLPVQKNIDRKESTMMVCGDGEVAVARGNGKAA
jgi:hypothetical protein